jgi:hypothetical protein
VAAQAVVEHRARAFREGDNVALLSCGPFPDGGLDQLRRLLLLAPPRRKEHRVRGDRRGRGRLCDQPLLFNEPCRRAQLTLHDVRRGQPQHSGPQLHEGARIASYLSLASGQGMQCLPVAPLHGDAHAGSASGEKAPAAGLASAGVQGEEKLKSLAERRGGRRVSVGQQQCERVEHDVHRPRGIRSGRCGAGGLGRLPRATGEE